MFATLVHRDTGAIAVLENRLPWNCIKPTLRLEFDSYPIETFANKQGAQGPFSRTDLVFATVTCSLQVQRVVKIAEGK